MSVCECTVEQYLNRNRCLQSRIDAIEELIIQFEIKFGLGIENSDISEYDMDDGQMKVKTKYKTMADLSNGILMLEQMKHRLLARANGRKHYLRSGNY